MPDTQAVTVPSAAVLEQAARWYVRLSEHSQDAALDQALHDWLNAHPSHKVAWARMQKLQGYLGTAPAELAMPTLALVARRRTALRLLGLVGAGAAVGTLSYRVAPWQSWSAQHRTAVGETRQVPLADGSMLILNTDTAVDVVYDAGQRRLILRRGEILVQTTATLSPAEKGQRPFSVTTPQGRVVALGTRFTVAVGEHHTQVAVYEHAVDIYPLNRDGNAAVRLNTGQAARFDTDTSELQGAADPNRTAWTRGSLIAIDQPLGEFIATLSGYRRGRLVCDPAIAALRVSGAFRLADTDAVLENLTASLPVKIVYFTRFWVRVEPA